VRVLFMGWGRTEITRASRRDVSLTFATMPTLRFEKTFKRRGTVQPDGEPAALAREFSSNPQKPAQWAGFIRRMKLLDVPELAEIVVCLRKFLIPPLLAASASEGWNARLSLSYTGVIQIVVIPRVLKFEESAQLVLCFSSCRRYVANDRSEKA
jgi:hypothetical protein